MLPYEPKFLIILSLTILIETLVLFGIVRPVWKIGKTILSNKLLLFSGFFTTFSTLPYLWFIFPYFIQNSNIYTIASESFAVIVETIIYYFVLRIGFKRAFLLSFICNMISFLIGLILFKFGILVF